MYHQDSSGKWLQDKGPYHQNDRSFEQDTRHAIVYIGSAYAYFGSHAYANPLPAEFRPALKKGQGIKYVRYAEPLFGSYLHWLQTIPTGLHGNPRDAESIIGCSSCSPEGNRGRSRTKPCT
ncbi:MAG: hypothetical protein HQ557_06255 [Bacteroidetes bacterium]|nr:hypothetical protein [Bacteroidota bacterium]